MKVKPPRKTKYYNAVRFIQDRFYTCLLRIGYVMRFIEFGLDDTHELLYAVAAYCYLPAISCRGIKSLQD
eukprot:6002512-Amphidinium_carterae.1